MSITKLSATLTQVLAPTAYTSLNNPVYMRTASGSVLLAATGSGTLRVFQMKDSYTATWNLSYTNQSYAFDDNLTTYAYYSVPGNTAETDALTVDFSAVAERYIHVRLSAGSTSIWHRLYISSDGTTWTKVLETSVATPTSFFIKGTFRYARITVQNVSTSSYSSQINEIASFTISNAIFTRTISYTDRVVMNEIQLTPYWLWVDPSPSLTVSVYERTPPSTANEVWIL